MTPHDVALYNRIALGVNGQIYDYYAGIIRERTGITSGLCLDLGCGGGYLGLALARITRLRLLFLDCSSAMLGCLAENLATAGLDGRAGILCARVQALPLADNSVDLAISRGSLPFWEELPTAFREIRRVLRPGGRAYLGGGLGDPRTREARMARLRAEFPEWRGHEQIPRRDDAHYATALAEAAIGAHTLSRGETGIWIEFSK